MSPIFDTPLNLSPQFSNQYTNIGYICDSYHSFAFTLDFATFSAIIAVSILIGWIIGINYMKYIRRK